MSKIEIRGCTKNYVKDGKIVKVLSNVNYSFFENKFYAIMGDSGAGKTTLINIISGIITPDEGSILFDNNLIVGKNEFAKIRNRNIGLVYQSFLLNHNMTSLENVLLPTFINKSMTKDEAIIRAKKNLNDVGLNDRINHYPRELSGGEKQRVAFARALINNPSIILADEPTGNLDEKNEKYIFELLKKLSSEEGKCVIVVTHNPKIKKYADIVLNMNKGELYEDE